jgi:hypothetical protein
MEKEILEYLKYGCWILFGSGIVFEFSPIKINPISSILRWFGKRLNQDVEIKISQLGTKVDEVQIDLQDHKVESWRRDILDFASQLMDGQSKTKENYDNIIKLHDRYEKYILEKHIENGQIDLAYEYISSHYKECFQNNSFYTGK